MASENLALLAVPALAVVVLSTLLSTADRTWRSMRLAVAGMLGVLLGGPSAIMVLGAQTNPPSGERTDAIASGEENESASKKRTSKLSAEEDSPEPRSVPIPIVTSTPNARGQRNEKFPVVPRSKSVEPLPAWVNDDPKQDGEVYQMVVSTDAHFTVQDCWDALDKQLKTAADEFICDYLDHRGAARAIGIDTDYIKKHLRHPERTHLAVRETQYTGQRLYEAYAQIDFDQPFRDDVQSRWEEVVAKSRLSYTALISTSVLGLLSVLFCYFRLDTATRGFYTGRLQFLAVAAILSLITVGVVAVRWIPWM